jgi:alpha-tubulin suppressor-like RCC1 family protein
MLTVALGLLTALCAQTTFAQGRSIRAWGANGGALGDGTTNSKNSPVRVLGMGDVISLSAGARHSLALMEDGTVRAWGDNGYGQLGNGTTHDQITPVPVSNLRNIVAIAAGGYHNLALKSDGSVWAWGRNSDGQLGDNTTINRLTPFKMGLLSENVTRIATGLYHSVALRNDGYVYTFGRNGEGQLADGTTANRSHPESANTPGDFTLSNITEIGSGRYHCLAVKINTGKGYAWGYNVAGQIGDGTTANASYAIATKGVNGVGSLLDVTRITGGTAHSVALMEDGTLRAWGDNAYGQLGDGSTTDRVTPVAVSGLGGVSAVVSGSYHMLALLANGTIRAWGRNNQGQLGDGTMNAHSLPTQVPDLAGVTQIASGDYHSLALRSDGSVWAWGDNEYGQLGDGSTTDRLAPVETIGLTEIGVATGDAHSLALSSSGLVWAWGSNGSRQLGDDTSTDRTTPILVKSSSGTGFLNGVLRIAAGTHHSLAIRLGGSVWAWGSNQNGRLGDGTTSTRDLPIQVIGLSNIVAIAGYHHSLAVKADGTVWAWGRNGLGQLGDGTTTQRLTPVAVKGQNGAGVLTGVRTIAAGEWHSLALKTDGTVWAWGENGSGQLGDGTFTDHYTPAPVSGLTHIVAIAGGAHHSLALKADGTVWAWGRNNKGQLGDGTTTESNLPVQVQDGLLNANLSEVTRIAAGYDSSVAVKADGIVYAWGNNSYGELGDGTNTNHQVAMPVSLLNSVVGIAGKGAHYLAMTAPTASVSGTLTLESIVNTAAAQPIRFLFRPLTGGDFIPRTAEVSPDGVFTLTKMPRDAYSLWIKGDRYLSAAGLVDTSSGSVSGLIAALRAADATNDNSVDVLDLNVLISAFDTVLGSPDWDVTADFNFDDSVDVLDLALLIGNFDSQGDP